jgi:hypothetical protein
LGNDALKLLASGFLSGKSHSLLLSSNALGLESSGLFFSFLLSFYLGETFGFLAGRFFFGGDALGFNADSFLFGHFLSELTSGLLCSALLSLLLCSFFLGDAVFLCADSLFSATGSKINSSLALCFKSLNLFLSLLCGKFTSGLLSNKSLSLLFGSLISSNCVSLCLCSVLLCLLLSSHLSFLLSLKTLLFFGSSFAGSLSRSSLLNSLLLSFNASSFLLSELNSRCSCSFTLGLLSNLVFNI